MYNLLLTWHKLCYNPVTLTVIYKGGNNLFCSHCGNQLVANTKFCGTCGASVAEMVAPIDQAPPPQNPYEVPLTPEHTGYTGQAPYPATQGGYALPATVAPPKKNSKVMFVALGLVVAILFSAIGVAAFTFINHPSRAVARAVSNSGGEFAERISTTPLQAIPMLFDIFEYGTLNVGFSYSDRWETISGHFSLAADASEESYALRGQLDIDGFDLGFAAYINNERVAIGVPQITGNYYGFNFSTFRRDFRNLAQDILGLSNSEIDEIANIVEWIDEQNNAEVSLEDYEAYLEAFTAFMRDAESGSERGVDVRVGLDTVSTRRVDYVVNARDLTNLLSTWVDIMAEDDNVRAMFNGPMHMNLGMGAVHSHSQMIRELRSLINELEDAFRGRITISFYIGSQNRLVQIAMNANLVVDGETIALRGSLNFGNSATDTWHMTMSYTDARGDTYTVNIAWEINSQAGTHEHVLSASMEQDAFYLTSVWNTQNGEFTFNSTEIDNWGTWENELLSGVFTISDNDFTLQLDFESDWSGSETSVTIYTDSRRADTGTDVRFTNISEITEATIDRWEDALWDLGW